MPGKIITTYISNVQNIKNESFFKSAVKLYIARGNKPMHELAPLGFKQIIDLAPTYDLLQLYQGQKIDWENYVIFYRKQMTNAKGTYDMANLISKRLGEGKTLILCCYEKDHKQCHRFILSNFFTEIGYECCEYRRG